MRLHRTHQSDPEVGRFTSQDSYLGEIDNPPSLHRFFYGNANPTRFVDPDGHATIAAFDAEDVFATSSDPRTVEWETSGPPTIFGKPARTSELPTAQAQAALQGRLEELQIRSASLLARGFDKVSTITLEPSDFFGNGQLDRAKVLGVLGGDVGSFGTDLPLVRRSLENALRNAKAGQTVDISEIYSVAYAASATRATKEALKAAGFVKMPDRDSAIGILANSSFNAALIGLEGRAPHDVVSEAKTRLVVDVASTVTTASLLYRAISAVAAEAELAAAAKSAASANANAPLSTVYRFADSTRAETLLPNLSRANWLTRARVNLLMKSRYYREWRADLHMQGNVRNSPFVSLVKEPGKLATSSDPWARSIVTGRPRMSGVQRAPDVGTFNVPPSRLVGPRPDNLLSLSESEILFEGNDLAKFLVSWRKNPF